MKTDLLKRIDNKTAKIGVVGLGYVGLPFAVEKAKVGFSVLGIDRSEWRVEAVNKAKNYISDVVDADLTSLVGKGLIRAVNNYSQVAELDVIVICVPTPLTKQLTPDLQYIESVTRDLAPHLRRGQLISLESTTYPGTTEEVMLPILENAVDKSGRPLNLKVEKDFYLSHSPERVDPGNKRYTTKNTNKVVGGVGPESLEVALHFYKQAIEHVVPVSSAKAAELVKVFENTFRAVNIALVNELTLLCDRMDLNVWEVLDAAFTKPFGIMPFYPGPGVGGHCIPIDPHYLEWKSKELNFTTHFIALAGEINRKMPEFVLEKTIRALNDDGLAISRSKILLMGVSYKKDLDDWRESPATEVLHLLEKAGATMTYHDPFVPQFEIRGKTYKSAPLTEALLKSQDLVMITTDHSSIDYAKLVAQSKHVFDTRNATKRVLEGREKITLL
jgi:UDP-N-acetyl-D-glucosamine dehydrogenase